MSSNLAEWCHDLREGLIVSTSGPRRAEVLAELKWLLLVTATVRVFHGWKRSTFNCGVELAATAMNVNGYHNLANKPNNK